MFVHRLGFLEFFNKTTLQWIPLCDTRFTERNAQVACRQLGHDSLNVYVSYDRRYELHPGSLIRVWSWPEPLQVSTKLSPSSIDLFLNKEGEILKHYLPVHGERREARRLPDQTKRSTLRSPTRMFVGQPFRFHQLRKKEPGRRSRLLGWNTYR